jgi:aspartate/methionine/tyrosine aminotransferase
MGTTKVYYIPPLYITLHTALDLHGILTIPVTQKQPYESGFKICLPSEQGSTLLLTDPVWFTGVPLSSQIIAELVEWQRRTSSVIFVDGSLQYLPWNGERYEATSQLDSSLTFRLVCPVKQLCTHGYRFSYMLVPDAHHRALAWTYTNMFGPAPADSLAFGHVAIAAAAEGSIPRSLMTLASRRYSNLRDTGVIESSLTPNCGYFVFAKILVRLPDGYVQVDGSYFGQDAYSGYSKLNLLSPSLGLLTKSTEGKNL